MSVRTVYTHRQNRIHTQSCEVPESITLYNVHWTAFLVGIKGCQIYWGQMGRGREGGRMREESSKWRDYKLLREEASVLSSVFFWRSSASWNLIFPCQWVNPCSKFWDFILFCYFSWWMVWIVRDLTFEMLRVGTFTNYFTFAKVIDKLPKVGDEEATRVKEAFLSLIPSRRQVLTKSCTFSVQTTFSNQMYHYPAIGMGLSPRILSKSPNQLWHKKILPVLS